MSFLEQSGPWRQKGELRLRGDGAGEWKVVSDGGRASVWEDGVSSGDGLYNNVSALHVTELYILKW